MTTYPYTDLGNTMRFVDLMRDSILYSEKTGWWGFSGKRWERSKSVVIKKAMESVDSILGDGTGLPEEHAKDILKWHRVSQGASRIEAITRLAVGFHELHFNEDLFNASDRLLNCSNGTLDLDTGLLRAHNPADHISAISGCAHDEHATCPRWEKFISEITGGNEQLAKSLQQIAGYGASGFASERCLFILYGMGANGKSIFLDTLTQTLGSYATVTDAQILMSKDFGVGSNDLAALHDRRLVCASETQSNHRLDEARVKHITGDTRVSARFLYGEFFEFTVHFKLFLATNHKPSVTNTDKGIWDRLRLLPFTVTIPDDLQIPRHELLATFAQESPGILNWISQGYALWRAQDSHLKLDDSILDGTSEYREDQDALGAFVNECLVVAENATMPKKDLYQLYRSWTEQQGMRPVSSRSLRTAMLERGFKEARSSSMRGWAHLALSHEGCDVKSSQDSQRSWYGKD